MTHSDVGSKMLLWLETLQDPDPVLVEMAKGLSAMFDLEPTAAVAKELLRVRELLAAAAGEHDDQGSTRAAILGT